MSNQVRVGIFAFVSIVIFVLGFYFLKGINLFSTKTKYYAIYDRVDGLYKSNQVTINGYRIGMVNDIQIDHATGKVRVEIRSEDNFPIPANSIAGIEATDLVGGKQIAISLGDSKEILKDGDTIRTEFKLGVIDELGTAIKPLIGKVTETLEGLDSAVLNIKIALNKNDETSTIGRLNNSLANIQSITFELDKTLKSGSLDHSLKNIEGITTNIHNNNAQIDSLLKNLSAFSAELKETKLKQTVNEIHDILADINSGKGSIGKLVKSEDVYNKLDAAIANLDKLLIDVKARPYRYINISVFGGGAKKNAKFIKEEDEKDLKK